MLIKNGSHIEWEDNVDASLLTPSKDRVDVFPVYYSYTIRSQPLRPESTPKDNVCIVSTLLK